MVTYCIIASVYILACFVDLKIPHNDYPKVSVARDTYVWFAIWTAAAGIFSPTPMALMIVAMLGTRVYERNLEKKLHASDAKWETIKVNLDKAFESMLETLTKGSK